MICILIYAISSNYSLTNLLFQYKSSGQSIFSYYKYQYGDLYGLSDLSYFRKRYRQQDSSQYVYYNEAKKINLYAICDNYVWAYFKTNKLFYVVDKLRYSITNNKENVSINLDTAKTNVLLLEFSERNLREVLGDTSYTNNIIQNNKRRPLTPKNSSDHHQISNRTKLANKLRGYRADVLNLFFNKNINTYLESIIWDIAIFRSVKELKADFNYNLFKKVDPNVYISKNGKQLYLAKTIDTNQLTSSFKYLPDVEKDSIVSRLNRICDNAKKTGFNNVYLSIIPNPISILEPHFNNLTYNNLVQKIQNDPNLRIPYINLLDDFSNQKQNVYAVSDSHWNYTGAKIWLNKFNAELKKDTKKKP